MRLRTVLFVVAFGCSSGVQAPPLVVPTADHVTDDEFTIDPRAPYAQLFRDHATWRLPGSTWIGAGPTPTITCDVSEARSYAHARVAYLTCTPDRELGDITGGLPHYGLIATQDGLWFTEHLAQINPIPEDDAGVAAWVAAEPMRLAATPAPVSYTTGVDPAAEGDAPAIVGEIDAFARGGDWCLGTENAAGGEAVRSILCVRAKLGVVGGTIAVAAGGIVSSALTWGEAPEPPASRPFDVPLDVDVEQVTLLAPGTGKRSVLALTGTAGSSQSVTYDISAHATSDAGTGTKTDVDQPSLRLVGTTTITSVEPNGRFDHVFTIAQATATGDGVTPALTTATQTLVGATFASAVDPDGKLASRRVHVEHPLPSTPSIVAQVAQSMDTFIGLPTVPVAKGAQWTVSYPTQIVGNPVVVTLKCFLIRHDRTGSLVSIVGSIAPIISNVDGGVARFDAQITGTTTITPGQLVPSRGVQILLVASIDPTPGVANPARRERHVLRVRTLVKTDSLVPSPAAATAAPQP
jgi:hypothetical protein